jgi:LytS/YehU family sensor histidine kinase
MRESAETAASNPIEIAILHKGEALAILSVGVIEKSQDHEADLNAMREIAAVCGDKFAAARAQEEVKRKEELLTRINALLAESQLASLRAQMNPHFVFNCLNSIQESIIMKNYAEASHYLNKFSKLFRQVLQNSSQSLIPLSEEISVLRLYLELEHMRFQGAFEFTIQCDEELETDEIMIPSMLLQPFVENSLWHGLMHKESDRKLSLRFFPKNDDVFVCEIEDNGIGREKAAEIKKHKTGNEKHKSRGIGIAMDRLRLIRLQQGQHATIEIIDLRDADGQATGTRVVCELSSFLHQSPKL